jgi:hypothetical protein
MRPLDEGEQNDAQCRELTVGRGIVYCSATFAASW